MHFKMLLDIRLIIIFVASASAIAKEEKRCDIVEFSINDPVTGTSYNQNFTEKYSKIIGRYNYYSVIGLRNNWNKTLIFWSNEDNAWIGQRWNHDKEVPVAQIFKIQNNTRQLSFPGTQNWTEVLREPNNEVRIRSRCWNLTNKCLGTVYIRTVSKLLDSLL